MVAHDLPGGGWWWWGLVYSAENGALRGLGLPSWMTYDAMNQPAWVALLLLLQLLLLLSPIPAVADREEGESTAAAAEGCWRPL